VVVSTPMRIVANFQLILKEIFPTLFGSVRGSFVHILMYSGLKLFNQLPE
jgi:hypothetical protein